MFDNASAIAEANVALLTTIYIEGELQTLCLLMQWNTNWKHCHSFIHSSIHPSILFFSLPCDQQAAGEGTRSRFYELFSAGLVEPHENELVEELRSHEYFDFGTQWTRPTQWKHCGFVAVMYYERHWSFLIRFDKY